MTRILCLWFPRWPLERLLAAQPELRQRNVLLYEQPPQGGLRVVASTDASARPGMPLAEALAMVQNRRAGSRSSAERGVQSAELEEREPGESSDHSVLSTEYSVLSTSHSALHTPHSALHLEPHDPWADRHSLIELAELCRRYSPTVGIEDSPRPECLFLDLTGLAPLYASEAALVEQIIRSAECGVRSAELTVERVFTIRAAVADTLGAAWGLARYGVRDATASSTPHSAFRIPHSALPLLPLAALRLPADTLALLSRLGLHRVGQVEALPRDGARLPLRAAVAAAIGPDVRPRGRDIARAPRCR